MTPDEIKARVGKLVTEGEMADMVRSNPVGRGPNDGGLRSGVLSFSFGPGGVRLTGAEVRVPGPAMPSSPQAATTVPAKQDPATFFRVVVSFEGDDGDGPTQLGVWAGVATGQANAHKQAMDAHWDSRLDSASCRAVFETEQLPRYLVCEGWGHIFAGTHEQTTRWVMDRAGGTVVGAEVLGGVGGGQWVQLGHKQIDDLAASLRDNDVLDDPQSWGLEEVHQVPDWAMQRPGEASFTGPDDGVLAAERSRA